MIKVAIVSGTSRGLGEALAADLLARGWEVIGIARHDARPLAHERYRFVRADLADAADVDAALEGAFARAAARYPSHAVLVNNAAMAGPTGVLGKLSSDDITRAMLVNLAAPAALANLFCRTFVDAACDRRIINVSSGAAESTIPGLGAYSVAKAGLEMLTRMLAADHRESTLRAITLRPGIIDTEMQVEARSQPRELFPSVDLFVGFHDSGQLVPPATVARKTIERLIEGPVESGRTYSYAEL
ncbi:MAG TPA: SDR family NAD(P)-dependent oxidoreductase [Casimicrobiaceae bacterium]|jgi:NAD(P)-dependent dehydrogenase (short-subunit alcohol dehydrogenase family)